jgi:hypothetical protein
VLLAGRDSQKLEWMRLRRQLLARTDEVPVGEGAEVESELGVHSNRKV